MDRVLILKQIKEFKNFKTDGEFADFLGITPQVLSNWKSRNTFDVELLYTKCEFINPEWLLTGRGEMLKDSVAETAPPAPPDLLLAQREIIDLQKDKIKLLEQALQDQRQQVEALKKELAHCHSLAMRPGSVR